MRSKTLLAAAFVLFLAFSPAAGLAQDSESQSPQITVESITIEPSSPAADTLCKLKVTLKNHGSEIASQLDFKVRINDQALPVYRNQIFMFPVPAGETAEIKLYNFWST